MKKVVLFFLLLGASLSSLHAQSWLWGKGCVPINYGSDQYTVAIDNRGSVYTAGWFISPSITFGSYTLTSLNQDGYLVKYDSSGNVLWAAQSNVSASNYMANTNAVTTDNFGNVYVTGSYNIDQFGYVAFGSFHVTGPCGGAFLVKYNSSGKIIWVKQSISPNYHCVAGANIAATDKSGNIYMFGGFNDTVKFGSQMLISNPSSPRGALFLAKYDSSGNVIWAKQADISKGSNGANPTWISIDNANNVYLAGTFLDTLTFGPYALKSSFGNTSYNSFLTKYDSNGNIKWARQNILASSTSNSLVESITADKANNIYMTGSFIDTIAFGAYTLNGSNSAFYYYGDIFLVKYDTSGNVKWVKQSTHTSTIDAYGWSGYCLSADTMNNIYMTAGGLFISGNGDMVFQKDTFYYNATSIDRDPAIVMEMDTSGNILCSSYLPNTGGDDDLGIASSPNGSLAYISGDNFNTIIFNKDTLYNSPPYKHEYPFVARWQPCNSIIDSVPKDTIPIKGTTEPCGTLFIPTAFSPNNDGQNDMFYVRGNCINTMDLVIYDRWGNKIFESENESVGWDGTYKGEPMNTGTYVWYLKGTLNDGTVLDKKGNVTLVR